MRDKGQADRDICDLIGECRLTHIPVESCPTSDRKTAEHRNKIKEMADDTKVSDLVLLSAYVLVKFLHVK